MSDFASFDFKAEPWLDDAACAGYDTDWWFPDDRGPGGAAASETTRAAKAICRGCPVRVQCLDYAMRAESGWTRFGIFGGLTADARRRLGREAS